MAATVKADAIAHPMACPSVLRSEPPSLSDDNSRDWMVLRVTTTYVDFAIY
jgi:hypothetical protein